MDELSLTFLPFPHVYAGSRRDGITHAWPAKCLSCRDRQCERTSDSDIGLCSYGVNYCRVDATLLIAGVVMQDDSRQTGAHSKMLRAVGRDAIRKSNLEAVVLAAAADRGRHDEVLENEKREVMRLYRESEDYKKDIVDLLRPSLEQTFAQVHDYRQLVSQIIQNVNVILEKRFPGLDFDAQLDKVGKNVRAIYWAARLMEFKLQSALFLVYPERIADPRHKVSFKLHGAIHKYIQIYRPLLDARGLRLVTVGDCHGTLTENPDAVGVIPHAFLDNAVKYSPDGAEIVLTYAEDDDQIDIRIDSLGPRIRPGELSHVFELFYRGKAAQESPEDGTGFGLGLAQHIADHVQAKLSVQQEAREAQPGYFRTSFSASFVKPIVGEGPPSIVNARARRRGGPSAS